MSGIAYKSQCTLYSRDALLSPLNSMLRVQELLTIDNTQQTLFMYFTPNTVHDSIYISPEMKNEVIIKNEKKHIAG